MVSSQLSALSEYICFHQSVGIVIDILPRYDMGLAEYGKRGQRFYSVIIDYAIGSVIVKCIVFRTFQLLRL